MGGWQAKGGKEKKTCTRRPGPGDEGRRSLLLRAFVIVIARLVSFDHRRYRLSVTDRLSLRSIVHTSLPSYLRISIIIDQSIRVFEEDEAAKQNPTKSLCPGTKKTFFLGASIHKQPSV